jgi:hypothetical protein
LKAQKLKSRVVLYAPNSHAGGGIILLKSMIKNWPDGVPLEGYFDFRALDLLELKNDSNITWVKPTITSRLKAEISLSKTVSSNDVILFMNSLPPLFISRGRTIVFLQNRNLVDPISLRDFKLKQSIRIVIERVLSYIFRSRVDEYIVQTDSFKRDLETWYKRSNLAGIPIVTVLPFMEFDEFSCFSTLDKSRRQYDFIYVADGLAQKNHLALFDAWEILADKNCFPSLAITLPVSEMDLLERVSLLQEQGLKIVNLGWLSHTDILLTYNDSRALIFPSLRESFGLPLVEASKLKIPILASEMDYVYDVCEPEETFDPTSPHSISRAVGRFLGVSPALRKVEAPEDFISYIFRSKLKNGNFGEK